MSLLPILVSLLTLDALLLLAQNVRAYAPYNWTFTTGPRQCADLSISVTGKFLPPLKTLIVPIGPSPLNYEVRKVMEVTFELTAVNVSFQLPYPTGSKFNAFVTDAKGYVHGQTGIIWTVRSSDDDSCFDPTEHATSFFTFSLSPPNLTDSKNVTISWDPNTVQGTPSFIALVPGSDYRDISPTKLTLLPNNLGVGYIWRNTVPTGVDVVIIGGDNRGMGSGGFLNSIVERDDSRRIYNGMDNKEDSSKVNVGAVVGVVIGPVVVLGVLLFGLRWWFCHQKRRQEKLRVLDLSDVQNIQIYEGNYTINHNLVYGQRPMQQLREEMRFGAEMVEMGFQQPPAYTTANAHQGQVESDVTSSTTTGITGQKALSKSPGPFARPTSGTTISTSDGMIGKGAAIHLFYEERN